MGFKTSNPQKTEVKKVIKEVLVYQTKIEKRDVIKYKYIPQPDLKMQIQAHRVVSIISLCVIAILLLS